MLLLLLNYTVIGYNHRGWYFKSMRVLAGLFTSKMHVIIFSPSNLVIYIYIRKNIYIYDKLDL